MNTCHEKVKFSVFNLIQICNHSISNWFDAVGFLKNYDHVIHLHLDKLFSIGLELIEITKTHRESQLDRVDQVKFLFVN